jgi:hypothetical protein
MTPNIAIGAYLIEVRPSREMIAAMAMQGFMANKDRPQYFNPKDDAEYVLAIADALIAALAKP